MRKGDGEGWRVIFHELFGSDNSNAKTLRKNTVRIPARNDYSRIIKEIGRTRPCAENTILLLFCPLAIVYARNALTTFFFLSVAAPTRAWQTETGAESARSRCTTARWHSSARPASTATCSYPPSSRTGCCALVYTGTGMNN